MPPKLAEDLSERLALRPWTGPAAVALAATLAALLTLAPDGRGPGIACDEPYHVSVGKRLVSAWRNQGLAFFRPDNVRRNFPWTPDGPPVHPPLGNWVLGWTHHLFDLAPDDPRVISVLSARFAPALALGLLALLVGLYTAATEGPLAGTVAAGAAVLVPRVFGHAHLAALDMFTAVSFVAAVLAAAWAVDRGGQPWRIALAGLVWGLAMLTRLHGLLAAPPIAAWLVWRLRRKAWLPATVWLTSGLATLLVGWPWLWLDPLHHFRQFLGTSTGRQVIHVFYAGQAWADRDVPRHYAVVMVLAVLPLGLLLLGCLGVWAKRRPWKDAAASLAAMAHSATRRLGRVTRAVALPDQPPPAGRQPAAAGARPTRSGKQSEMPGRPEGEQASGHMLVLGALAFVLLVFSWPGTPIYDGVRLLLVVFPLWAVLVGIGARWVVEHVAWSHVSRGWRLAALGVFVAIQGAGLVAHHPCHLSHYSLSVGGLWGAEKLGFEVTYWGEAVREPLLAEAALRATDSQVFFVPNLAPFQAPGVNLSSASLLRAGVELVGWDERVWRSSAKIRYALVYNRKADSEGVVAVLRSGKVVTEYSQQGVWLARLVELPPP